ncbi:MAG: 4-hydroxybenzoate octaprenyltransferase [Pseudomonadota bacterium]
MYRLTLYMRLIRLDKPIGILLLLWPTLSALWIAAAGRPAPTMVAIFVLGTVLMRSAGCAINDFADRNFDRHVARTAQRPVTAGLIAPWEAVSVAVVLAAMAFLLILPLNGLTKMLSVAAVVIAASYPYFKRFFAIPQAYLGVAFGFGIPMAFAATLGVVPAIAWWLLLANIFWAVAYDTEYAMVDREDDIKIGMRTSAITFGRFDIAAIMSCYAIALGIVAWVGWQSGLGYWFMVGVSIAAIFAMHHYRLIHARQPAGCFAAFHQNNWLGAALFGGIAVDYAVR